MYLLTFVYDCQLCQAEADSFLAIKLPSEVGFGKKPQLRGANDFHLVGSETFLILMKQHTEHGILKTNYKTNFRWSRLGNWQAYLLLVVMVFPI